MRYASIFASMLAFTMPAVMSATLTIAGPGGGGGGAGGGAAGGGGGGTGGGTAAGANTSGGGAARSGNTTPNAPSGANPGTGSGSLQFPHQRRAMANQARYGNPSQGQAGAAGNPAQAQILTPPPINTQPFGKAPAAAAQSPSPMAQPNNSGFVHPDEFRERFGAPAGPEPPPGVPSTVDRTPNGTTPNGTPNPANEASSMPTTQSTPATTTQQDISAAQSAPSAATPGSTFQQAAERLHRARLAARIHARRAEGTTDAPARTAADSLNTSGSTNAAELNGATAATSGRQPSTVRADGAELFVGAPGERRDPSVIPPGQIATTPATGSNTQNIDNANTIDPATGLPNSTATGSNTQNLGVRPSTQGDGVFTPLQTPTQPNDIQSGSTEAGTPSGARQMEGLRQRTAAERALRAQGVRGFNLERAATKHAVRTGNFADDRPTANRNSAGGFNLQRDFGLSLAAAGHDGFQGLAVSQVTAGTVAERLGLMSGDRLMSVNGIRLGSPQNLISLLGNPNLTSDLFLRIQRGDQFFSVRVSPQQLLGNLAGESAGDSPTSGSTNTTGPSLNEFR